MGRRIISAVDGEENRALDRNVDTRTIITWPAVMLAASRKASVIGRTENLMDSTSTKNGLSQAGAPLGRSEATNFIGKEENDERISLNQRVSPKDRVNRRWLVSLKTKGVNPTRLETMRNTNSVEINAALPRNFWARDRES